MLVNKCLYLYSIVSILLILSLMVNISGCCTAIGLVSGSAIDKASEYKVQLEIEKIGLSLEKDDYITIMMKDGASVNGRFISIEEKASINIIQFKRAPVKPDLENRTILLADISELEKIVKPTSFRVFLPIVGLTVDILAMAFIYTWVQGMNAASEQ